MTSSIKLINILMFIGSLLALGAYVFGSFFRNSKTIEITEWALLSPIALFGTGLALQFFLKDKLYSHFFFFAATHINCANL